MPQGQMFTEGARTRIDWRYAMDPLKPHEAPMFYCSVSGPKNLAVEHGLVFISRKVVWEEVNELLVRTWEGYLFGEPGDVRAAVGEAHRTWQLEAALRPPL